MVPYSGDDSMRMLLLTILAGVGGALSYMWRETKAGRPIKLFRVALSACLVAFICFHLGFVYQEFGLSQQMIWALNGFTAVIGVEAIMSVVTKLVFKFLKVDERDIVNENLISAGWTPPGGITGAGMAQVTPTDSATGSPTTGSSSTDSATD